MDLNPETQRFMNIQAEWLRGAPPWQRSAADLRVLARDMLVDLRGEMDDVKDVRDVVAGDARARLFIPHESRDGVLVWLHGGGWIVGDLDSHEHIGRTLAHRARHPVLLVDYRLAPENPYPAAADDTWSAVRWAYGEFGATVVGGDSAGGNLAASVALRAAEGGLPLAGQILVYPTLEYRSDSEAHAAFERGYEGFGGISFGTNSREGVRRAWDAYVPDVASRDLPDAAPMKASSLAGVAPATIILAEHDILKDEGIEYADRLRQAGVEVEVISYPGQIHGFLDHPALLGDARSALDRVAHATGEALGGANS